MPITAHRPITALVVSVCTLLAVAGAAALGTPSALAEPTQTQSSVTTTTASGQPATCTDGHTPPPPVDKSEEPKAGKTAPSPLPIPAKTVGGGRLGECGVIVPDGTANPPGPNILNSASWLIADLSSGAVLAAKDPHARHRPASLIKLLTALVALKELDPTTVVIGDQADANQEGSKVGIGPGGKYTVRDLVTGLLLESGNDAAHALARKLGGVDETVRKMNQLAKQLGALDTRAATPSGLDGPGMSTSAYDQAVIFRAAFRNPEIAKAIRTAKATFPGFGGKPSFQINNDNKLLTGYTGALGGKTGFTDDARQTFIFAAEKGGRRLVAVLIRGENTASQKIHQQAAKLLDYGFSIKANTEPVGQVVERAPSDVQADGSDKRDNTIGPEAPGKATPFGTIGLPLTILAAIGLVFAGVLYIRKRKAKARAALRG